MSSKYSTLLEDQDVRRWIDNLAANSAITAEVYLRTMGLYCDLEHTTPNKILKDAPSKRFRDQFTDFVHCVQPRRIPENIPDILELLAGVDE